MFKDRLREARLDKQLTQAEVAKRIGVAKSTYTGYELGNSDPDIDKISKIMTALDIDANFLWQDEMDKAGGFSSRILYEELKIIELFRELDIRGKEIVKSILEKEHAYSIATTTVEGQATMEMIVYDFPAAAGIPVYAEDGYERIEYPASKVPSGADFGIRIAGDSMEPTIKDGDVVFIRKTVDLRNGDIGIFMIDDESVCKRYYKEGKQIELHSDNPDFPPITIKSHQRLGIVGKVMGYK